MIYRRVFDYPWRFRGMLDEFERMRQMMDRLVTETEGAFPIARAGVFPLVNLTENKDNFFIRAELPGVEKDDLEISATSNSVSISGERKIPQEEEGARYHRREREAGRFSRIITLGAEIQPDKVEAGLKNGVLTVTIPKAEIAKPKQITVK
ncbi:MAG: Hsp20/alpha crystallin family protein [Deltaproteobacteria bacterium]|nr:Hsp20/alpha crystallin family protein [Deltaproteobacteria bacterium]MBW1954471.1 Hsp20/alpha crystallin family protein [Deltaproteobacteria bacterium]MBW2042130.1 Hsp20/alpha crystallin family protein [Deltaproteobacteria bacterium]MBW2132312.1 Hsp20/alpha crystallin family protein [Deltaproteobacteria bacterium]